MSLSTRPQSEGANGPAFAAVELICAAQAVDLRSTEPDLGRGTTISYHAVRRHISFTGPHQAPTDDLEALVRWLESEA